MDAESAFAVSPRDMYEKMMEEFDDFQQDPSSIRHAINFTLTAYHLSEWVWKSYLKEDAELREKISKNINMDQKFYLHLQSECAEIEIIRELANNIKHFYTKQEADRKVGKPVGRLTFDTAEVKWEDLHVQWGYDGLVIITSDNKGISVLDVFAKVKQKHLIPKLKIYGKDILVNISIPIVKKYLYLFLISSSLVSVGIRSKNSITFVAI